MNICEAGVAASCGHPQTGSAKVFVTGKGVCRVGIDTAVGVIVGPGSTKVFAEGFNVSLPGDAVAKHGKNKHAKPNTLAAQTKVFA